MIEARHIEGAFQRFEDFAEVQHGIDPELPPDEIIEIAAKRASDPEYIENSADANRNLRRSVMDDQAYKAFIKGVDEFYIGPMRDASGERLIVSASFIGLVIGLTAAQLQAESG
jgi:hypothetical protein